MRVRRLRARVIDEDVAHQFGGDGKEVRVILPIDVLHAGKAQISFVDEGSGLQGVVGGFLAEITGGETAQFFVHKSNKALFRTFATFADFLQKACHLAWLGFHPYPSAQISEVLRLYT